MAFDIIRFVDAVDDIFWRAITKNRVFRDVEEFGDLEKEAVLKKVGMQLKYNSYLPAMPIQYYDPKSNGVLRGKKLFEIEDICVYYYCVVEIQDELIKKIKETPNVFGGFRINSNLKVPKESIRDNESDLDEEASEDFYGEPEVSKVGYKKEWSDYQNLCRNLYNRGFDHYIHLDIAHFYDDIDLTILESMIRMHSSNDKTQIIDILMSFLENSSKSDYGFLRSYRGLPQEDLGEMSRVLANFYLSNFDAEFSSTLAKFIPRSEFEYLRYADDMWIAIKGDKSLAHRAIQNASLILHSLRLHLNDGKTRILSRDQFYEYWCFKDWDDLFSISKNIQEVVRFIYKIEKKSSKDIRWFSPYLYALRIIVRNKGNLKYFKSTAAVERFINSVISKEKILSSRPDDITGFISDLLYENYSLRSIFSHKINNTIIPNLEYFCLNVLLGADARRINPDQNLLRWYLSTYRQLNTSSWQWYSRCIILGFISSKFQYYITLPEYQDEIIRLLNSFSDKKYVSNFIEKRYQIKFIFEYSRDIPQNYAVELHGDFTSRSLWYYLTKVSRNIRFEA